MMQFKGQNPIPLNAGIEADFPSEPSFRPEGVFQFRHGCFKFISFGKVADRSTGSIRKLRGE